MLIYMAGVVHMPKSITDAPAREIPSAAAFKRVGPDRRLSRPMAMVIWVTGLFSFSAANRAKAMPKHCATWGVSTASSPTATPLTSVPLFSFIQSTAALLLILPD